MLSEPLVHFLGLGLALFVLYAVSAPVNRGDDRIIVSAATVASIKAQYQTLRGRAPSADELKILVDTRVTDEMLTREGRALGLDRDDAVIARRVRQKYELMAEEEDGSAPTDADLRAFLKANPDRFRAAPVLSFRQLMVPLSGSAADVEARIGTMRRSLEAGTEPPTATSLLPANMRDVPLELVARDFGSRFANALVAAPPSRWSGPTPSAYGLHFIKVEARTAATMPPLDAIRSQIVREWENARRIRARDARIEKLRRKYDVVIAGLPGQ